MVVAARRQELLDELVDRITAAGGSARAHACDLSDLDAVDELVATVERDLGGIDILINNAGRSIRRPLAESLDRWHDVERTMALNYYSPLRLIRGLAPGMRERGDGHIINVSTWGVLTESSPCSRCTTRRRRHSPRSAGSSKPNGATTGVHSTTLFYPLVITPMIAPTRAYDGLPGLSADEAADWMITAARVRPVRIAPRMAVTAQAMNSIAPGAVERDDEAATRAAQAADHAHPEIATIADIVRVHGAGGPTPRRSSSATARSPSPSSTRGPARPPRRSARPASASATGSRSSRRTAPSSSRSSAAWPSWAPSACR